MESQLTIKVSTLAYAAVGIAAFVAYDKWKNSQFEKKLREQKKEDEEKERQEKERQELEERKEKDKEERKEKDKEERKEKDNKEKDPSPQPSSPAVPPKGKGHDVLAASQKGQGQQVEPTETIRMVSGSITYHELVNTAHHESFSSIRRTRVKVVERRQAFQHALWATKRLTPFQERQVAGLMIKQWWIQKRNEKQAKLAEASAAQRENGRPQSVPAPKSPVEGNGDLKSGSLNSSDSDSRKMPVVVKGQDNDKDLAKRCLIGNLEGFVFQTGQGYEDNESNEPQGLERFDQWELRAIFNSFGLLSSQRNQIRVYEEARDQNFRANVQIRESYGMAYLRTGKPFKSIEVLKKLLGDVAETNTIQAWNFMGDAYNSQRKTAAETTAMLKTIRDVSGKRHRLSMIDISADQREQVERYWRAFGDPEMSRGQSDEVSSSPLPKIEEIKRRELTCKEKALEAYGLSFKVCQDFNPLLRTLTIKVEERMAAAEAGPHHNASVERLDNNIKCLSQIIKFGIERDGGPEAQDFWCHSGMLEAMCFSKFPFQTIAPVLQRVIHRAIAPHQLGVAKQRVLSIYDAYSTEDIKKVVEYLEEAQNTLERTGMRITLGKTSSSGASGGITMAIARETFFERTFTFRGCLASPRPSFLPGSIPGRSVLPDMIFSTADAKIFEQLLTTWKLDEETDSRVFVKKVVSKIRAYFGTDRLQDPLSEEFQEFLNVAEAATELMGITSYLKGMTAVTNAATAMLFFGGPCEQAQLLLGFYTFWQSRLVNRYLVNAYTLLEDGGGKGTSKEKDRELKDLLEDTLPFLLSDQMRGGHIRIYAPVCMQAKGEPTDYFNHSKNFVHLARRYDLEAYKRNARLSEYELLNSLIIIEYTNGRTAVVQPTMQKNDKFEIPNLDGVPLIGDATQMESLDLYNLVDDHTVTYMVTDRNSETKVELLDSFYNENFSNKSGSRCPFSFGNTHLDLKEYLKYQTFSAGTMPARQEDGTVFNAPVKIQLIKSLDRTDMPALTESMDDLKFIGMTLPNLVVPDELSKEDMAKRLGISSAREKFFRALVAWYKSGYGNDASPKSTSPVLFSPQQTHAPRGEKKETSPLNELEIDYEYLHLGVMIGRGAFGEVYKGSWLGTAVAVKKLFDQESLKVDDFYDELNNLRGLRHPNIVTFMGACTRPPNQCMVTEFCSRGSLFRVLHRTQLRMDPSRRLHVAMDVAKGMNYLHNGHKNRKIIHRDLKTPNLLVDRQWTVKVADFGLAKTMMSSCLSKGNGGVGTPPYMAPEVIEGHSVDEKVDVYSFGIILWELQTRKMPWEGLSQFQIWKSVKEGLRPDIPEDADPEYVSLMTSCWAQDPKERPGFKEILGVLTAMWENVRDDGAFKNPEQQK